MSVRVIKADDTLPPVMFFASVQIHNWKSALIQLLQESVNIIFFEI